MQAAVVQKCRELNKPVIVASQLLESMIEFPTPTRAEVRPLTSGAGGGGSLRMSVHALRESTLDS